MAGLASWVRAAAPAGERKRVVVLGTLWRPTPREYWTTAFAEHGLVDGRDVDVILMEPDYTVVETPEQEDMRVRRAAALRPVAMVDHTYADHVEHYLLPRVGDASLVIIGNDDILGRNIEALNRRGLNVTGVMYAFHYLVWKRFQIVKELRPKATRIGIVGQRIPLPADPAAAIRTRSPWRSP